jgi:uncharacterized protein
MPAPHLTSPLELKFVAESGTFEGYASVFHVTDSANDRIAPGAFEKSLQKAYAEDRLPPLLWQHDAQQPIGIWHEMQEDSHGLFVRGELFVNDITQAREAYKLMRENVVTGLSIGYRTIQSERDAKTGARILTEIELLEISMVTFPANPLARVRQVKSLFDNGGIPSEREFEAFLRDAGLSRKQAKGVIADGYKALTPRDAVPAEDTDVMQALRCLTEQLKSYAPS